LQKMQSGLKDFGKSHLDRALPETAAGVCCCCCCCGLLQLLVNYKRNALRMAPA
jgi:transposase